MMTPLRINDVYPTIQGEGVQAGVPMVLIRLQGCGVGCPWCDTRETWRISPETRLSSLDSLIASDVPAAWAEASPDEVAAFARSVSPPAFHMALVTGGEPADQELAPLVRSLRGVGLASALETSGTALGHVGAGFDWVCVSPKEGMPGGKSVREAAVTEADEIKFVVGKPGDVEKAARFVERFAASIKPTACILLQPLSDSAKAVQVCIDECMARGWRLSLQTHKQAGLR